MTTEIPTWAAQRACDLAQQEGNLNYLAAFARYIAEHEQEPVDPLHKEAIELVIAEEVDRTGNQIEAIRSGMAGQTKVALALAALRRGIEIGGGND